MRNNVAKDRSTRLPSARIPVSLNEQLSVQEQLKVTGKKCYVTVNYFF